MSAFFSDHSLATTPSSTTKTPHPLYKMKFQSALLLGLVLAIFGATAAPAVQERAVHADAEANSCFHQDGAVCCKIAGEVMCT